MIQKLISLFCFILFSLYSSAQSNSLSSELKEISGLEVIDDSLLVAHNDSGNSPHLYLINLNGDVVKKVLISNAKNIDWEDIAADSDYLYLGDIGNNSNKRKDLTIYRIRISELAFSDQVTADKMQIAYADQKDFPPSENERNFDSECLISAYGFLWIFSKNNSKPFDGNSRVYRFKFQKDSSISIPVYSKIDFGKDGYYFDTPTAGDFQNDTFYFSTYNRYLSYKLNGTNFNLLREKKYPKYNQKEAFTIKDSTIWVANEYNKLLGGAKLNRMRLK
jgi:hypothetical protein